MRVTDIAILAEMTKFSADEYWLCRVIKIITTFMQIYKQSFINSVARP